MFNYSLLFHVQGRRDLNLKTFVRLQGNDILPFVTSAAWQRLRHNETFDLESTNQILEFSQLVCVNDFRDKRLHFVLGQVLGVRDVQIMGWVRNLDGNLLKRGVRG